MVFALTKIHYKKPRPGPSKSPKSAKRPQKYPPCRRNYILMRGIRCFLSRPKSSRKIVFFGRAKIHYKMPNNVSFGVVFGAFWCLFGHFSARSKAFFNVRFYTQKRGKKTTGVKHSKIPSNVLFWGSNSAIRSVKQAIFDRAKIVDKNSAFWRSANTTIIPEECS